MTDAISKVKISLKHDDRASLQLINEFGEKLAEVDDGMPNVGVLGGDYTDLVIDNNTGKIIGWVPITMVEFNEWNGE